MKVQITTHQQAPGGPAPNHHHHHHHHNGNLVQIQGPAAPSYGHTPAAPKYMTTPLLQTIYPSSPIKAQPPQKPFVKSDQITTLNMVHSSTPKITAAISSHGAIGVKSAKFNGQFRDTAPAIVQKSTLKPHPVMNKLQSHMAIAGFRPKQPVATSSNRLEQFINPNHLYGTYITFGQSPASLSPVPSKSKFFGQLGTSLPSFDTQTLKSFFNAPGYTPSAAQFKKLNYIHQQQQQQQQQLSNTGKFAFPHFNQIPADLAEFPKKYVTPSSAEKELTKGPGGLDSTPLFPHLPPSVLTPFFQQVQQQQQQHISGNKYNNFNLKTQHPAPPVASQQLPSPSSGSKHTFSQSQFQHQQQEQETLAAFGSQSIFSAGGSSSFGPFSTQQPLPIEHKPFEIVKFKEAPGKQLPTKYNEIHDEYSKNLVPPPPSTQQAFLPTVLNHLSESASPSKDPIEILNKYNINPHSPLQDANRFSYEFPARPTAGSPVSSTASSTTTTTTTTQFPTATTLPRQQYYQPHHYNSHHEQPAHGSYHHGDHAFPGQHHSSSPVLVTPINELGDGGLWLTREKYLTTEKPNVFKNLFRPVESEYKQHKLMHPSYTGLPPNRRPASTASTTTTTVSSGSATTISPWDQSTEEPVITHSFFTIEDAIADPTLVPPKSKSKYKYTTDADEENRQDDLQLEIVTIGPFVASEESPIRPLLTTTAPIRPNQGPSKGGSSHHRRRRPKPSSTTTTEYSTEPDSTETTTTTTTTNTITDSRNRNRIRFRQKSVTTLLPVPVETESVTTFIPPTPPPLAAFASSEEFDMAAIKKFRKKPHFTRNRYTVLNQREEERPVQLDGTEPSLATPPATTTTSTTTTTTLNAVPASADAAPSVSPALGGGFRSRYRPPPASQSTKSRDSQEETTGDTAGTKATSTRHQNRSLPTTASAAADSIAAFNSDESANNFSDAQNKTARTPGRGVELNRPRFSIKEYRNKLNRTTSTAPSPTPATGGDAGLETTAATKLRFPTRNRFLLNARLNKTADTNEIAPTGAGATTERAANETTTRSSFRPHGTRTYNRYTGKKPSTETPTSGTTANRGQPASVGTLVNRGRIKLGEGSANRTALPGTTGSTYNTTASLINRRPPKITLRQRIQNYNRKKEMEQTGSGNMETTDDGTQKRDETIDSTLEQNNLVASSGEQNRPIDDLGTLGEHAGESNSVLRSGSIGSQGDERGTATAVSSTTESYRHHETAIMKISPKETSTNTAGDDYDLNSASSDYSKRVVELTLSGTASRDRGSFKSVNKGLLSRKVPGYFTLATEDPILPIEAFFPQVKKPTGGLA
uniref:Uncharacterized protein n=1 Tax=Anopheles albimanus TaxID=7167 RepID=A0A182F6C2_ANOAL